MAKPAIYSVDHELDFKEPSPEEVQLCPELAVTIKSFGKSLRESMFHLCMIAYGIRRQNLKKKTDKGGNNQSKGYLDSFDIWYEQNDMKSVYGKMSNFTKYAMSGRLLYYTRWQTDKENPDNGLKYIDQLPSSLSALYALSTIIWSQGESATDESRATYRELLIKPVRDGSRDNAFICRSLTAKDVERKIKELEQDITPEKQRVRKQDSPITIPLIKVKVHEGLLQFNRRGNKRQIKGPDIEEVKALVSEINKLIDDFGSSNFAVESNFDSIEERYLENKDPDFGRNIP